MNGEWSVGVNTRDYRRSIGFFPLLAWMGNGPSQYWTHTICQANSNSVPDNNCKVKIVGPVEPLPDH